MLAFDLVAIDKAKRATAAAGRHADPEGDREPGVAEVTE